MYTLWVGVYLQTEGMTHLGVGVSVDRGYVDVVGVSVDRGYVHVVSVGVSAGRGYVHVVSTGVSAGRGYDTFGCGCICRQRV